MIKQRMREKAIDAVDLLNDFDGDLITSVNIFRDYIERNRSGKISDVVMPTVQRMCLSSIILTLCKYNEFYDHYKTIIPKHSRSDARELKQKINKIKIVEFRNKCIGHIWNNETGAPLRHSEIMERLMVITEGKIQPFLDWINDPTQKKANTVVSIIEKIRDTIMDLFNIDPSEFIDR